MSKIVSTTLLGNNESTIADAISSIINYVDECIVIDTGIKDNSLKIAREIAGNKLFIVSYKWINDFSDARNFALNIAQSRGADWAITLDSDERLYFTNGISSRDELIQQLSRYKDVKGIVLTMPYISKFYSKERIFQLPLTGSYEGPTHECYCGGANTAFNVGYFTEHGKTPEQYKIKFLRDIDILENYTKELKSKNKETPRWYFYLGESYRNYGLYEKAAKAYNKCWSMNGWDEEGAWAAFQESVCYVSLERYTEALEAVCRGLSRNPSGDLLWHAGWICWKTGAYQKAIYWAELSLQAGCVKGYGTNMYRTSFRNNLGLYDGPYSVLYWSYKGLGNTLEAEKYLKLCQEAEQVRHKIENGTSRVNSFDIFDTLIGRYYYFPDSIFKTLEEEFSEINFTANRKEAERRCGWEASLDNIYNNLNIILGKDCSAIKNRELELEHELSFPILENLNSVKDGDILVSDMYLNKNQIMSLLKKNGFNKQIELYVGNGIKWSGKIWPELKEKYIIETHLGDNEWSDVGSPKQHGINGVHFPGAFLNSFEKELEGINPSMAYFSRAVRLMNPYPPNTPEYELWVEASNYTLIENICSSVELEKYISDKKYKRILFSTRDCYHMYNIFSHLFPKYASSMLHTSRKVYLNPSEEYKKYAEPLIKDSLVVDKFGTGYSFDSFSNNLNSDIYYIINYTNHFAFDNIQSKNSIKHLFLNTEFKNPLMDCIEKINYGLEGTLIDYNKEGPVRKKVEYDIKYVKPYFEVIEKGLDLLKNGYKLSLDNSKMALHALFNRLPDEIKISKYTNHEVAH